MNRLTGMRKKPITSKFGNNDKYMYHTHVRYLFVYMIVYFFIIIIIIYIFYTCFLIIFMNS